MAGEVDRIAWRIDEHDKRLHAGAEAFAGMRVKLEDIEKRAMRWVILAAFSALASVGAGAWWAAQRSSSIEATARVVADLREDVHRAMVELTTVGKTLALIAKDLAHQTERDQRQEAELDHLRETTGRRR